jgi:hypothetical protein
MKVALVCTGFLGLLVFGLGFWVSATRGFTRTNIGHRDDPTDRLYKLVRAHANAAEYAPMLAVLMIALASRGETGWVLWAFVIVTIARYLHAAGMILSADLTRPQPLRFAGALVTYIGGIVLALVLLLRS